MPFASLSKETRKFFVPAILCCDIRLLLLVLHRDSNLSSSELSFGTCTIAIPFVAFVGSLVLVSDLFGLCLGKLLTTVCFGICWCSGGHCWSRVKVFFFGMGLLVV